MSNWQKNTTDFERIKRGSPSSYWSYGLERRLNLTKQFVNFKEKKVLDVGCGVGMFLKKFRELGADVYGVDIDKEKIEIAKKQFTNVQISGGENIPFVNNNSDVVWLHEVLEHVNDDQKTIEECMRVLKGGGKLVIFCPNRLWPFETHGIYFRGKYKFGNIPLVTWMPNFIYKKLTPHVRNYSNGGLKKLFEKIDCKIVHHSHVFPGFDGLVAKLGTVGKLFRKIFEILERTPFHNFGISHFLIVEKK